MKLSSNQPGITEEHLKNFFEEIEGVNKLELWDVRVLPSGHGHYEISAKFILNNKTEIEIKRVTSNMLLIDAWKEGSFFDPAQNGYYDNWDEVVDAMLSTIDAKDEIIEAIYTQSGKN